MALLSWVVFGAIVGAIAKLMMPGKDPGGLIVTCLLGVAGSVVGGFVGQATGLYGQGQGAGWVVSILGAVLLLFAYRRLVGQKNT